MAENRGGHNKIPKAKKQKVLEELKAGKSILETANTVGVGTTTVARIRVENRADLPTWKAKTVAALTELHGKIVEDLQETYKSVPPGQKSILLGVVTDKIKSLAESESQTITHNHLHISHGDVNSLFTDNKTGNPAQNKKDSGAMDKPIDISTTPPADRDESRADQ